MSDPSPFVLKFKEEIERCLDSLGRRILNESRDQAHFNVRIGEFDETAVRMLNELCRRPEGVRPGRGDPERRAARERKGTPEQRMEKALERANEKWALEDGDDGELDSPPAPLAPKDEWDNAVLKANHPDLLLPGPKLAARMELEALTGARRQFIFNLAESRFGDDSDRVDEPHSGSAGAQRDAMEYYPAKFSPTARAGVEAELIRAGRLHDKRKREWNSDPPFRQRESLQKCILSVFLVYAREAIELGKNGVWTVDQVRAQALEGLRLITIEVAFKYNYDLLIERSGSDISRETRREFEASPEWEQFEDELLVLAESAAKHPIALGPAVSTPRDWASSILAPPAASIEPPAVFPELDDPPPRTPARAEELEMDAEGSIPAAQRIKREPHPNPEAILVS